MERGLNVVGDAVYDGSQKEVPVDTGALKASGRKRQEGSGWSTVIVVSYSTPYAVFVHEIGPDRPRHFPPTKWKFLQDPISQNEKEYVNSFNVSMASKL